MPTKYRGMEELEQRLEKIFDQRDGYERNISEVIGRELSPSQLLELKQLCADIERCEQGIERTQERIEDLAR
jgi:ubiquinone biosynthesis protein UbiJ